MLLMMIVRRMIAQPQLWTMPWSHFKSQKSGAAMTVKMP